MTKLYDGLVADLIQNDAKRNPEIQALSYAILQEKRRLMDEAKKTRTLSMIDELPEHILDVLAVELRTPLYKGSLTIESKRALIKATLPFYEKMGTPDAVNRILDAVYPGSYIEEWFFYGGEPYHFQVIIETSRYREPASATEISKGVAKSKRLSAHSDGIIFQCNIGIAIRTQARGFHYHSAWTGRHECGTVPWRNTRAGLSNTEIALTPEGEGFKYNVPLNGTQPFRNTRGGFENGKIEIDTAAKGYEYTSEFSGQHETGTIPWRNTKGGLQDTALTLETLGKEYDYHSPVTGTQPYRNTKGGAGHISVEAETAAEGYVYTSGFTGQSEAGTVPNRTTKGAAENSVLQVDVEAKGYPYSAPVAGKQEAGTKPVHATGGTAIAGELTAEVEGKAYHYKTKWCGRSYCKS